MKQVSLNELKSGMVVAKDVIVDDQLIVSKGVVLSDTSIDKLKHYIILRIAVEDEMSQAFTKSVEEDLSYSERVKRSPEFKKFKNNFDDAVDALESSMNDVVEKNKPLDVDDMLSPVLETMESLESKIEVFSMMQNMRDYDDATYVHCLNVALICNIFSRWLDYSNEETRIATACGLLHDIGKIVIEKDIIQKPEKLSNNEYEIIKKHTTEGYNLLKDYHIDLHIKNAALLHHERCDGSGYPYGLKAKQIDPYAKMVAIADVYDAMTATRVYRDAMCPFSVISEFEDDGLQKYDPKFLLTFLNNIENTFLQDRVRLSNGREGEIVFINKEHLDKPTVKCGMDFIDLSIQKDIYIEAII